MAATSTHTRTRQHYTGWRRAQRTKDHVQDWETQTNEQVDRQCTAFLFGFDRKAEEMVSFQLDRLAAPLKILTWAVVSFDEDLLTMK